MLLYAPEVLCLLQALPVRRKLLSTDPPFQGLTRASGDDRGVEVPPPASPPFCLLDSSDASGPRILFDRPRGFLKSRDGVQRIVWDDGAEETHKGNSFGLLDRALSRHPSLCAAGYWGYELGWEIEALPGPHPAPEGDLDCWIGLFEPPRLLPASPAAPVPAAELEGPRAASNFDRAGYCRAVEKIQEYIAAGDCYQVNLSQRFTAPVSKPPWQLYRALCSASPAPYAAYIDTGDHQVLSSSPELFLRVEAGRVTTRPIKGTRPRGLTPDADSVQAEQLQSSEKDRAELLMIVDLERNDLGKVCRYGSVKTPELFKLESYATVHHLVATVEGELRAGVTPLQALRACFPGGSITGAPKIRAMEIIQEIETVRRGVYTGAIGWVAAGRAQWNIAIRTMVIRDGTATFHAGGGVVADSVPESEYEETLDKARALLSVVGGGA